MSTSVRCRSCGHDLTLSMMDLGLAPFSNALLEPDEYAKSEMFYPLHVRVCPHCWLAQLDYVSPAEAHFNAGYVYFSSYSSTWLEHARNYVENMTKKLDLGENSRVMEIASNDGYLLQYFVRRGISCLGIEPSANTAAVARRHGVMTRELFFGRNSAELLAKEGWKVDLLIGNNVLAHVPDINDFVGGMRLVLKKDGVITLEFPHLSALLGGGEFDTIYHEHYSYLSLVALMPVFRRAGLRVFAVEELPTHGGSLRVFVCHEHADKKEEDSVARILNKEKTEGIMNLETYTMFSERAQACKRDFLEFLIATQRRGERVCGYGAAAKGNTLLNYCGIRRDMVQMVADKNPAKQGKLLPGSRIPVCSPAELADARPDWVIILPWNLEHEILGELVPLRKRGTRFLVAVPSVHEVG